MSSEPIRSKLRNDLRRCEQEIEICLRDLDRKVDGRGALLGFYDWNQERRLILAEMEKIERDAPLVCNCTLKEWNSACPIHPNSMIWREDYGISITNTNTNQVTFVSGAASTKAPRLDLIPYPALCRLADRFELGLTKHKERAWNARQNDQALSDKEWLIARAMHAVHHAYKFIDKLEGRLPDDGDDDASAVMWAGACLTMAKTK